MEYIRSVIGVEPRYETYIENDIPAKEEASSGSVDEIHSLAKWYKHANNTGHHCYERLAAGYPNSND